MARTLIEVPLSKLVASKRNPRKVKPAREAHARLVALIRSQGLLQPLVVRPAEGKPGCYLVIAGNRRLAALKEIHRGDGDVRIACVVKDVDDPTADSLALGENYGREPMHPLDEAESFARLATHDGKDADAIAAEFGVTVRYVRQRMKLAELITEVKAAYRENVIDTATAEPEIMKVVYEIRYKVAVEHGYGRTLSIKPPPIRARQVDEILQHFTLFRRIRTLIAQPQKLKVSRTGEGLGYRRLVWVDARTASRNCPGR
jgi:ParB/RepB/Spo0J family partition protein